MKYNKHTVCFIILAVFVSAVCFCASSSAQTDQKMIRLATVEWEPYYGRNLKNQGYISEITRKAFKRVGYDVEIRFMPWKRAMHDTRNGYFDGLMGLYHTKEREKWLAYSNPIAETRIVFFGLKGRNIKYSSLTDLKPYKIGIERQFAYTEEFDNAEYLEKEPVRNIELNFNKLIKGRIDLVAASQNVFLHMISTRHPQVREAVQIIEPPLTVSKIYNGITRKKPNYIQIVKDFNRGLWLIKSDGAFDRILEKHGF